MPTKVVEEVRVPLGDRHSNNQHDHDEQSDEDSDASLDRSNKRQRPKPPPQHVLKKYKKKRISCSNSRSSSRSSRPSRSRSRSPSQDRSVDSLVLQSGYSQKENHKMGKVTRNTKKAAKTSKRRRDESESEEEVEESPSSNMAIATRALFANQQLGTTPPPQKNQKKEQKIWFQQIKDQVRRQIWSGTKFCFKETKLANITRSIFDHWNLKDYRGLPKHEHKQVREQWVAINQEWVRVVLNDLRNYAQSQLRHLVVDEQMMKDIPTLTPQEVYKIAVRDKKFWEDASNADKIDFYHNVLLFKILGKDLWDDHMRRHYAMSAPHPEIPNKTVVTPNSEAFLVALYENCYEKWQCITEEKKSKMSAEEKKQRKDPRHKTKFIDIKIGVSKWGGWNQAGYDRCCELGADIVAGRKQKWVKKAEEAVVARVLAAGTVEGDDTNPKKKAKVPRAEVDDKGDDGFDEF